MLDLGLSITSAAVLSRVTKLLPPLAVGTLPHQFFTVTPGSQTFGIAAGFSGSGIAYTIRSGPAGVVMSNTATGTITVQTGTATEGDVVVRATNAVGFVEQTFPLFVWPDATFNLVTREDDGSRTVKSLAAVAALSITRGADGTVNIGAA